MKDLIILTFIYLNILALSLRISLTYQKLKAMETRLEKVEQEIVEEI